MDKSLYTIAFCGVDCGACSDYAKGICPGCRASAHTSSEDCMAVICCEGRGIAFCSECAEFPCENMLAFFEETDSHREAYARLKAMRDRADTK